LKVNSLTDVSFVPESSRVIIVVKRRGALSARRVNGLSSQVLFLRLTYISFPWRAPLPDFFSFSSGSVFFLMADLASSVIFFFAFLTSFFLQWILSSSSFLLISNQRFTSPKSLFPRAKSTSPYRSTFIRQNRRLI